MMMDRSFSGPLWHVAVTAPRHELKARDAILADLKLDAYVPIERVRGKRSHEPISRPLMPRYLFVAVDPYRQSWGDVLAVKGVTDILKTSHDVPGYVSPAIIEAMRKAEMVGNFDYTRRDSNAFKVDEEVRVSDGPFAGHNALIREFVAKMRSSTARKRAKLLVKLMGRMCSVEMDLTALEKL